MAIFAEVAMDRNKSVRAVGALAQSFLVDSGPGRYRPETGLLRVSRALL